jgi:uncharacterized protein
MIRRVLLALATLAALVCAAGAQAPVFPHLSGRVVDEAGIINGVTRDIVGRKLAEFEAKTGAEVVVATVPSLGGMDIDNYVYALAANWRLGQAGKYNGAILLIAPNAGKVAIQASEDLRDRLTDAAMDRIIKETLIPRLAADDIAGGVTAGIDDMLGVLGGAPMQASAAPAGGILATAAQAQTPTSSLNFPRLTGRIVDEAGLLDSAMRAELTQKLADLETKSTDQLVIVTLRSLQGTSIEDYGYQLGRAWQIGQQGKNNGVLLIVAPNERKVRIEVGYGLEGTLTDAISSFIIQTSILPRFKAGDFAGGIKRGAEDVIQVLTGDAEEYKQRAAKTSERTDSPDDLFLMIVIVIFILFVLWNVYRSIQAQQMTPGRRGKGGSDWYIPSGSSGGSSWSSGSSSGGGGFSGGGGSFGGGGSSGSW